MATATGERPLGQESLPDMISHPATAGGLNALVMRLGMARVAAGVLVVVGLLFAFSGEDGPVLCPLRRCTGGYCPGCGLTRSGGRLLRGDVAGSWEHHPYLLIGAVQLGAIGALWSWGSDRLRTSMISRYQMALMANLALMTAIWVVRMVGGSIPIPFLG
jgi:hypothetical protein